MPQVALGLWKVRNKQECIYSVLYALDAGYRHFDTAQIYGNEAYVGEAVAKSGAARRDLFITTKIWNGNQDERKLGPSFDASLKALGTDYVDLLLLHFPVTGKRQRAWQLLEDLNAGGRVRSIGVSNYTVRHLEELLANCRVRPAVNQVELHVYLQQPELIAYCRANGITVQAYSPLVHGEGMDNPVLLNIGLKYGKTPAQVMLRWCLDAGTVPLPKSTHKERIIENFDVFDFTLSDGDMAQIRGINQNYRTCWDPTYTP